MGLPVRVSVLAPDDVLRDFGAGALIRLERAASAAGAYSEIATAAVVAETFSYEINDPAGLSTSWYRTRFSDAAASSFSEYGTAFSPSAPTAYAMLDDLLLTMGQTVSDTRFWANAEQKLVDATKAIDQQIGYSALRSTGTKLFNARGGSLLHVHSGIVSLSLIELRLATAGAYTALQAQGTGWILEGDPDDPEPIDGIYYHVRLLDTASYSTYPTVRQGIRLTGTFGGDLAARRQPCIDWARQGLAFDPSNPGSQSGPDELGGAVWLGRPPRSVYDLLVTERRRFWCHAFGGGN